MPLRILMMGTGGFAVPTFQALLASEHDIAALVTRPDQTRGRRRAPANPMREAGLAAGLPILDPINVNTPEACQALQAFESDLFVVCDYGQILKPATLGVARLGGINLHGSLLPKYRGAAPVQWAVYHGDLETGNTIIHMTPALDAGPALGQVTVAIEPEETAEQLEARLAELGAPLVLQVINDLAAGATQPVVQDQALATKAPRLKKTDGRIDWRRSAVALACQIRAFQPWPGSYTELPREGKPPLRLVVHRATADPAPCDAPAGTVLAVSDRLQVATSEGMLQVHSVQPAGKRVLSAAEFTHGYRLAAGDCFASGD